MGEDILCPVIVAGVENELATTSVSLDDPNVSVHVDAKYLPIPCLKHELYHATASPWCKSCVCGQRAGDAHRSQDA